MNPRHLARAYVLAEVAVAALALIALVVTR
jgi:hypothetical protein